jgi:hypothetical protein
VVALRYLGPDHEADPSVPHDVWEIEAKDGCENGGEKIFVAQPREWSLAVANDAEIVAGEARLVYSLGNLTGLSDAICQLIADVWMFRNCGYLGGLRSALWEIRHGDNIPVFRVEFGGRRAIGFRASGPVGDVVARELGDGHFLLTPQDAPERSAAKPEVIPERKVVAR